MQVVNSLCTDSRALRAEYCRLLCVFHTIQPSSFQYEMMCAEVDVICCETVINPLEMFPHMISAGADDDDDDIKFLFTIRYTRAYLLTVTQL